MSRKKSLNVLILYGILFQVILGICAKTNTMKSPNILLRKKRLLSINPNAISRMKINEVPYVVQLMKNDEYTCIGNILMLRIILTAAHCIEKKGVYHVLSGSEFVEQGSRHEIEKVIYHPEYNPKGCANDLALIQINPGIDLEHSHNRPIKMYNGHIPPNTSGLVSGWGCTAIGKNGEIFPKELRSMITPIITEEECRRIHKSYQKVYQITDRDICAMDKIEGNKCGTGDSGAPLVINNQLVGVMAWNGNYGGPDVFMYLSHPAYRGWILKHIPPHYFYPDNPYHVNNQHYAHHS